MTLPDTLEQLDDVLCKAGQSFQAGNSNFTMGQVLIALSFVCQALIEAADRIQALEARLAANEQTASQAANVASCLANGMTPD